MIKVPNWTISCGVRELILDKTSTPREIIEALQRKYFKPAVYHFAETKNKKEKNTQAEQLIAYIKKRRLGEVIASAKFTEKKITRAWMWVVDRENLINYKTEPLTDKQLAEQNRLAK